MAEDPKDTQAERTLGPNAETKGLAQAPRDTATGQVRPQDGPMERPGTEAEEAARKA